MRNLSDHCDVTLVRAFSFLKGSRRGDLNVFCFFLNYKYHKYLLLNVSVKVITLEVEREINLIENDYLLIPFDSRRKFENNNCQMRFEKTCSIS